MNQKRTFRIQDRVVHKASPQQRGTVYSTPIDPTVSPRRYIVLWDGDALRPVEETELELCEDDEKPVEVYDV